MSLLATFGLGQETGGGGGGSPPVVVNFTPGVGVTITSETQLTFDVTDPNGDGFAALAIAFKYPTGIWELAYDGQNFAPLYEGVANTISGGLRFTIIRAGGWPSAPTLQVFVVDTGGNVDQ